MSQHSLTSEWSAGLQWSAVQVREKEDCGIPGGTYLWCSLSLCKTEVLIAAEETPILYGLTITIYQPETKAAHKIDSSDRIISCSDLLTCKLHCLYQYANSAYISVRSISTWVDSPKALVSAGHHSLVLVVHEAPGLHAGSRLYRRASSGSVALSGWNGCRVVLML